MWNRWVFLAVLIVAGCGGAPAPAPSPAPSPALSPAAEPSPELSSEPSPEPSSEGTPERPIVTAADGTRLKACADGTCEVEITEPVRIKLRSGVLKVKKVTRNEAVEFGLTLSSGGGGDGTLKGTCGTISYFFQGGGGRGEFCSSATAAPERPEPVVGEVALQLEGWTADGAAVLRVVTG